MADRWAGGDIPNVTFSADKSHKIWANVEFTSLPAPLQRRWVLVTGLVPPLHLETPKAVRGEVRIVLKVHFPNFSIYLSLPEPKAMGNRAKAPLSWRGVGVRYVSAIPQTDP
jgi:hypothetical protein